ncbi:PilZ domain-containing protein [Actinoplanes sp. NEAU-A12]|uniref:PilZ domain-containing protein n=1 Tax=Actinoplanes sandaracinus TaxID=3045177 RepID=A0ABT6WGW7_9ACTN|nr:PilZ domain-containing protein [Actinoplanes sandaracinus]MDI6098968.1 PilZ domain-containing protein [Actinoplanes sandaracinus]
MTASEIAAIDWPQIGAPVFLVLGEGVNFRSRLEAVDGDSFSVAAPLEIAGPAVLEPGHEFEVFWAPPRTRIVVPSRLIAVSATAPLRWTLVPTAPARHDNRRRFVRGGAGAVVRLDAEVSGQPAEGVLLDISEGGLRCWIDEPTSLAAGDRVLARVWLGASEAELSGRVHTVRQAPHGDPGQHLILTFDAVEDVAQLIRQYVYSWEIGERRRHTHA